MARINLTASGLRALRGTPGRWTEYYDTVQPGLEVRVSPIGTRSWAVRCWHRGRQVRVTLGRLEGERPLSLAQAREDAAEAQRRAGRGEDPRPRRAEPGNGLTIASLGQDALKTIKLAKSTKKAWTRLLNVEIVPRLGKLHPEDLDRPAIRSWGAAIVKRGSPYTALGAFEVLSRIYSWGISQDRIRSTPFVELEPPAVRKASDRWLTTEELRALWCALGLLDHLASYLAYGARNGTHGHVVRDEFDRPYVDATRLLILTVARREMVLGMRRSEFEALDGDAARWIIPAARMKSGRDHVVPLAPQAVAIVRRRLEMTRGFYLFPAGRSAKGPMTWSSRFVAELRDLVEAEVRRARGMKPRKKREAPVVPRWTIHGLRHSAATHMAEDLGVPTEIVSLILAHRPPGAPVSRIYNRAERLAERREALTRWAQWVEGLAGS